MTEDLSVEHRPITSLFPGVNHGTMAEYELRPGQVEFFHEHGYLSGVRILSDEQVQALRQELARLLDASEVPRVLLVRHYPFRVVYEEFLHDGWSEARDTLNHVPDWILCPFDVRKVG